MGFKSHKINKQVTSSGVRSHQLVLRSQSSYWECCQDHKHHTQPQPALTSHWLAGWQPMAGGQQPQHSLPAIVQLLTLKTGGYPNHVQPWPGWPSGAHLAEVGVHRGQLVCVHLHLVNGLPKDADSSQGLSEKGLSVRASVGAARRVLGCPLQMKVSL